MRNAGHWSYRCLPIRLSDLASGDLTLFITPRRTFIVTVLANLFVPRDLYFCNRLLFV
jgi:hypothetical protein